MSKHECTCIAVFSKAPTIGVRALEVIPQGNDTGGDLLCIGTYTDAVYLWHMTGEVCKVKGMGWIKLFLPPSTSSFLIKIQFKNQLFQFL